MKVFRLNSRLSEVVNLGHADVEAKHAQVLLLFRLKPSDLPASI